MKNALVFAIMTVFLFGCESQYDKQVKADQDEEITRLNNAIAQINMNPQNSNEFCESKGKIQSLANMITIPTNREYLTSKTTSLLSSLRRFVDDITRKEALQTMSEERIKKAAYDKVWKMREGLEIIKVDVGKSRITNAEGVYTYSIDYEFTSKKSGGLFGKDSYVSDNVRGIGKYVLTCNGGEALSYSAKEYEPSYK